MRISGRSIALGFASAALAIGGFTTPAAASSSQAAAVTADGAAAAAKVGEVTIHKRGDGTEAPAELGNPSEWGVVKIDMDAAAGSVSSKSEACVPASGGKWCYGWYSTGATPPLKYCYSNYLHAKKDHKSSVKLGGKTVSSGWVAGGDVSNAHRTAGFAYTCSTYYSIE